MPEKLFENLRKWRTDPPLEQEGVVVGADMNQEWLLPWWWENYSKHNTMPVAFADFGMSDEMREWCAQHGALVRLFAADIFVSEKDEIDPAFVNEIEMSCRKDVWSCRRAWFKKPLACLQSPFHKSLWIDLDCQILGSIHPLFALIEDDLAAVHDIVIAQMNKYVYNAGVLGFKRGLKLIEEWADRSIEKNKEFRGDEDILNALIDEQQLSVVKIPLIYNWSRFSEKNPDAVIIHWHGPQGKSVISHQLMQSNLASLGYNESSPKSFGSE